MSETMGVIRIELPAVLQDTARFDEVTKQAAVDDKRGPEWRCLVAQSTIVRAFAGADLERCGPEHVAWVVLLLRSFHCLEGARALLHRNADVMAEVLLRIASEIRLHQMIIRHPWDEHLKNGGTHSGPAAMTAWQDVQSRLRAYTAWAIASDHEYAADRTDEAELQGLYRATLPEELPGDPLEEAFLRFAFGEIEVTSEQEAELDRRQVKERLSRDVERLDRWLKDDRLVPWTARIEELKKDKRRNRGRIPTNFGQLFDDAVASFASSLRSLSLKHEYAWYARSSRLIHGNSIDLLTWGRSYEPDARMRLIPRSLPSEKDASLWVVDIANALSQVAMYLWAMRDKVLPSAPR